MARSAPGKGKPKSPKSSTTGGSARSAKVLPYVIASVFLAGNVAVLLPWKWTLAHFCAATVAPSLLVVERVPGNSNSLCLVDHSGRLLADNKNPRLPWPLHAWIDWLRINGVIQHSKIKVSIRPLATNHDVRTAVYDARSVVVPTGVTSLRFIIPAAIDLPAGSYHIRCALFADPPWGNGVAGGATWREGGVWDGIWDDPVLPGTPFLMATTAEGEFAID